MFETPIKVTREGFVFHWLQRTVIDVHQGEVVIPFTCIGGDFEPPYTEERLDAIAKEWLDTQPTGVPPCDM